MCTITRHYISRTLMALLLTGYWAIMPAAIAGSLSQHQPIQYGYLTWNASEPYWFNQYVGVGVEQRELAGANQPQPIWLTSANLVIGGRLFERLMVSAKAGYLSWPGNDASKAQQLTENPVYWGVSTRWRLNRQVAVKAQWQQIQLEQKEHLFLMAIDVRFSF